MDDHRRADASTAPWRLLRRWPAPSGVDPQAGLTLVEVLVAISIIGMLMASLTSFFVTALSAMSQQSAKQTAIQVADGGTELVRALAASAVLKGRDQTSSDTQWSTPVTGVSGYLTDMTELADTTATTGAGASAALPTTPRTSTVNGIVYSQSFYVGRCWQPAGGGACGASQVTGQDVPFLRVAVAVTWPCPRAGTCSYVTATLVSDTTDPLFNSNDVAQPPAINNPGSQLSEVSVAITSLQVTASGGAPPLTWAWAVAGHPPGLSIDSSGIVTGKPTTAGTYSVVITVTDARAMVGSATVPWTVKPAPTLTTPANQTGDAGVAVSGLQVVVTGGTSPYAWLATGLPAGLSIAAGTGVISGTPTTAGTSTVTVTVTDSLGATASTGFTWTVKPVLTKPANQTSDVGLAVSGLQVVVTGGTSPYAWSISGQPAGLSIAAGTGVISGTPTTAGTFTATVTVTDSSGVKDTTSFTWTVAPALAVTAPTTARSSTRGFAIFPIQATATGGTGSYAWTPGTLLPGVTITSGGRISGTPTTRGTYTVTVTATDAIQGTDSATFTWTVS